jgi:hypothetical protein
MQFYGPINRRSVYEFRISDIRYLELMTHQSGISAKLVRVKMSFCKVPTRQMALNIFIIK